MGLADMFIKLKMRYGSPESIALSEKLSKFFAKEAIEASAKLAGKYGSFPMYNEEAIKNSEYLKRIGVDMELIKKHGLRNSQITTVAPTGSISTMWGISGGIEPIFAKSYKRKTESIHNQDFYYDVLTPIVEEATNNNGGAIPEYVVTSHDIPWRERVAMQSAWQKHIDASISSTINLPKETTVEECYDLFIEAWKAGLKGVTVFRDGCQRTGILTLDEDEKAPEPSAYSEDNKFQTCPECGEPIEVVQNSCVICMNCGHSPCS